MTFDKQSMYRRLGWSALEDASYAGRACTIMVFRIAGGN
jgi:hypothetical protein